MSTLGIVNSDPEIQKSIEFAFEQRQDLQTSNYKKDLLFLVQEDEIVEFLKYALPEIVVINFSDPLIDINKIINQIQNDKWILNFGIIGLFDNTADREEELLKKYKAINVLVMLDNCLVKSHLVKSIECIEQNYQIIFQREFSKTFLEGSSGSFIIDNDIQAVPLYAGIGATILSQRGLINPDRKMHLQLALIELIINGIEHGSCGISYDEKTDALEAGISSVDLIKEKCKDPFINAKKVFFNWDIKPDKSTFIIRDQGSGFDVKAFIEKLKTQDDYSLHGRGIKMAAKLSHKLKYNTKGNHVALIVNHDKSVEYEVPVGFTGEQVVIVKKGDVIMREGDPNDFLYYISSGTYEVIHNDICVGSLSAQDIFMGEMSFLLNKRRSATIRATSAGKLVLLTQKTFINIIREYPHYGVFLSKLLAKRLVRSNKQAAERQ
ncbi:MAG: cyclic nucleotide-binding domain-containing protein [Treponema sp.]|nr:cyclic nucleotide-binding domain-containing protein [Treponema sp.]